MTTALLSAAVRQKRVAVLMYSLAGLALIWLYLGLYPSIAKQAASYTELLKSFPPSVLKAFGADITSANFEGLVGAKQFGFTWPLMMMFLVISTAGSSLAGEVERGTLGLWLSAPFSRQKIYWTKFGAGVIGLTIFTGLSVLTVIPSAALANITIGASHFLMLAVVGWLFGLAVYSLAMLISAALSDKGRVYAVTAAIVLGMYVANIISGLTDKLGNLKYLSFFYYYDVGAILTGKSLDDLTWVVFGGTAVVCALAGSLVFNRRDISI